MGAGGQSPLAARACSRSFTANDPQLRVSIDRQRALAAGLPLSEITSAMQTFLGSSYVNDFQFNNRAYRVYVQADQQFRSNPQDLHAAVRAAADRPDGAARQRRHGERNDGAAGHRPLQSVPVGDAERLGGTGRQLGRRAEGDGADRRRERCRRG